MGRYAKEPLTSINNLDKVKRCNFAKCDENLINVKEVRKFHMQSCKLHCSLRHVVKNNVGWPIIKVKR